MAFLRRINRILLPLVLTALASLAHAADNDLSQYFRFSGFASLGFTKGGNDILGFRRELDREGLYDGDWSFLAESSVGLQMDINPTGEFGGTIQLLARDTFDDNLEDSFSWGFLRYRFHPDWTVRVGRIGVDQYMLSEYRNLSFSYLWTRPPVELYTLASFDYFDGFDLAWTNSLGSGTLTTKLQAGEISNTFKVRGNALDIKLSPIVGLSLIWESDRWQARVSAARLRFDTPDDYFPGTKPLADVLREPMLALVWPQASSYADEFLLDDPYLNYFTIGTAYDNDSWQVQWEANYVDSNTAFYPSMLDGYLSVGRQIGAVTPFVLMAWAESQEDRFVVEPPMMTSNPQIDAGLNLLADGLQASRDLGPVDQHTLSFGVRWDVRYDIALKFQWDHTWVNAYGGGLWEQKAVPTEDTELNTFAINLNCIF
ncbi:MAG TPA: hypothetical protein VM553_13925 [Dongiaceae bacterium]|nr:hypothetical protein [Dongiaceae bacterium]